MTQGKNESILLTVFAAIAVMLILCMNVNFQFGEHVWFHKISIPEHPIFIEVSVLTRKDYGC